MSTKNFGSDNLLNEVINSDHAALQEMIDMKCPINVCGTCGDAPLHIAIYKRDDKMIEMLMAAGADIMFPNSNGDTALHVAARMGLGNVIQMLYHTSSDLNRKRLFLQSKNKEGQTALDIASTRVLKTELDLTRKYRSWDSETGGTLDDEEKPLQVGRTNCQKFLKEKTEYDIINKQIGSVDEMVRQNNEFQKTAGILRGDHYSSSNSRIYYSELDYPARLDKNAWIDSDIDFFLNYLPGVRKVVTKMHAEDFVNKTIRSGFNNAQLLIRRGEINHYIQLEEKKRIGIKPPTVPDDNRVENSDIAGMRTLRRRAKGRKIIISSETEGEVEMPLKSIYYNEEIKSDGTISKIPKTVEQMKLEVQTIESDRISSRLALLEHQRPPMRRIFTSNLQSEGTGKGKIEEGLYFVKDTHGQPKHNFGNLNQLDQRFVSVRKIAVDDRPSSQTNVLLAINNHAEDAMKQAKEEALKAFEGRKQELMEEKERYNKHMQVKVKYQL
jgi:hypothetical protein